MIMAASRDLVAIIGGGFSGICAAIELKKAGREFVLLDKGEHVGGTWRDNTYPGCACDVPSVLYSLSFAQNPDWSRVFSPQGEIDRYLRSLVDRFELAPYLRFGFTVEEMRYDERDSEWTLVSSTGEQVTAQVVISAVGVLRNPLTPDIPGLADFEGPVFHSAEWDHSVELRGKKVAVLGTGASAVQFVPTIAGDVERLTVFQRSPQWITSRGDRPYTSREQWIYRHVPGAQRLGRWRTYWEFERNAAGFIGNGKAKEAYKQRALQFIRESVPDPALREAVTPQYDPGCKRRLVSDEWYPTLMCDNVDLVTSAAVEIRSGSVVAADGTETPADVLVLGTGYSATDFLAPMKVFGLDGAELNALWKDSSPTHLGITAARFPNLFMLTGPNTALGHNSIIFMIESQMHYVMSALRFMKRSGARSVELRRSVQDKSYAAMQNRLGNTVWSSGCRSWYLRPNGRNDVVWPATTVEYWLRTRFFRGRHYRTTQVRK
jgi:cation diffusion facilitator CzcD-associated flavoprotein CzcO